MTTETASPSLELDTDEQELVGLEVDALLPALRGERRERYEALAAAVADGRVPDDLVVHLQSLLELALQTARARKLYRAEGEKVLTGLFRRTPAGRALTAQLRDINTALGAVANHELRSARVGMRTVGHFTVTLRTDEATLTLAVRPDGMNVDSVEVTDAASP
ncbi:MAG: hypothetical protein KY460_15300 [Actinobacteria bacterium]|nr:hypothetical protein [Actinomycetota bacterium]